MFAVVQDPTSKSFRGLELRGQHMGSQFNMSDLRASDMRDFLLVGGNSVIRNAEHLDEGSDLVQLTDPAVFEEWLRRHSQHLHKYTSRGAQAWVAGELQNHKRHPVPPRGHP